MTISHPDVVGRVGREAIGVKDAVPRGDRIGISRDVKAAEMFAVSARRCGPMAVVGHDKCGKRRCRILNVADSHLVFNLTVSQELHRRDIGARISRSLKREREADGVAVLIQLERRDRPCSQLGVLPADPPFIERANEPFVRIDDLHRAATFHDSSALDPDRLVAELQDVAERVRDQQHRRPAVHDQPLHALERLRKEVRVARAENLVDDEDVRLDCRRDRKHQTRHHSGGVGLVRLLEKVSQLRELSDVFSRAFDLSACKTLVGQRCMNVLISRELRMEPRAGFQQRLHLTIDRHDPLARRDVAGDQFQQRALAGAVSADDAKTLAGFQLEIDVAQSPEFMRSNPTPRHHAGEAERDEEVVEARREDVVHLSDARQSHDRPLRHSQ